MIGCSGKIRVFYSILILWAAWAWLPGNAQSATKITTEEIKMLVLDHVEKSMPWPPGTMRINFPMRMADISLPQERVSLEMQSRPGEDFIGDTAFVVRIISGGALIKEETVRVRLEVLMDIAVSARPLTKNREIAAEDVRVLKKWMRQLPANLVTAPVDAVGKVITLNLPQNSEITTNILKEALLIKKGHVIRIVLDHNNLTITTLGISEEDGTAEKVIRVKNLASNKTIYARVTGDSLVKVEF